jgi:hypothetical protein
MRQTLHVPHLSIPKFSLPSIASLEFAIQGLIALALVAFLLWDLAAAGAIENVWSSSSIDLG